MRVFVTPCTAPDFDAVAVTLRDSGHTDSGRARAGDLLHTLELDTHTLYGSDVVVALPGWRDCPESTTDVLTADDAGIPATAPTTPWRSTRPQPAATPHRPTSSSPDNSRERDGLRTFPTPPWHKAGRTPPAQPSIAAGTANREGRSALTSPRSPAGRWIRPLGPGTG